MVSGLGSLRSLFVQFWGTNIFIRNKMMNDENVEMKPDVLSLIFFYFQPSRALSADGRRRRWSSPWVEYGPDGPGSETLQVRHQRPGLPGHQHCCGQPDEGPDFDTDWTGKLNIEIIYFHSTAVKCQSPALLQ